MTHTQNLRDDLAEIFGKLGIEAYYVEAPEEAKYPYIVYDPRVIYADETMSSFTLEINAWDEYDTYSRVDTLIDKLEGLNKNKIITYSNLIIIYKGQRSHVPDNDKRIKRTRELFDLMVSERRKKH